MNGPTNTSATIARDGMMSHESAGETVEISPFTIKTYRGPWEWIARAYHEDGTVTLEATGSSKARAKLAILAAIKEWGEEANK